MKNFAGMKIFKKGTSPISDTDLQTAVNNFFDLRKKEEMVPIIFNDQEAHEKKNAKVMGWITNLGTTKDGHIIADGYYLDEAAPVIESGALERRSVAFSRQPEGIRFDHLALCGQQWEKIKGMGATSKYLYHDLPAELTYVEFAEPQKAEGENENIKEKNMAKDQFSEAELQLAVKEAEEKQKEKLLVKFAEDSKPLQDEIAAFKTKEENYVKEITALKGEVGALRTQTTQFAEAEKERKVAEIKAWVDGLNCIPADQKEAVLGRFVTFAENNTDEGKKFYAVARDFYNKQEALIGFSETDGRTPDGSYEIKTPTREEAIKAQRAGR